MTDFKHLGQRLYGESTLDKALVKLAMTNVRAYVRKGKDGASINVRSHMRRVKGSSLNIGDVVRDNAVSPEKTVTAKTDSGLQFSDGTSGDLDREYSFVRSGATQPDSPTPSEPVTRNPVAYQKGTGYSAARMEKVGNPGASGVDLKSTQTAALGDTSPLTDAEYEAHTKKIEDGIGAALKAGKATDKQFAVDLNSGIWQADRAALHEEIVRAMWKSAESVPNEGRAKISGGLGGAGKGTVLKTLDPKTQADFFTINSDDVKEYIAANHPDMIPEVGDLAPMERAALIHEESSHIADLLAAMAYAEKKNMIWDITMASRGSTLRRIKDLRAAGYSEIEGLFVDIPVETSVTRALARHRRGMEDYRNGKGDGGRYVPPAIIRLNKSDTTSSANRETFDGLRNYFDKWSLFDNSVDGRAPQKLGDGSPSAADPFANDAQDPFVNRVRMSRAVEHLTITLSSDKLKGKRGE